ncbi:hypothetical protein NA57DRAFT_50967 [Rhizodiscina lignyota]|uniref:Developmental regulatory protein wetA n=1 Tax=Rhizodiscina lignyota TaxID=1504668 RepID=A0A9P4IM85_9PEZI|nr:hypothetical protein NA57DRAFT_50967 [Rhizodiscina lignyota]
MDLLPERRSYSIRPSNKEKECYDAYDALFEQYVESDLFEPSSLLNGIHSSDDSTNLFVLATSSGASDNVDCSPIPDLDARQHDACTSWQGSLKLLQKSSALSTIEASTGADKAAALDPDTLSLDGFCLAPAPSPLSDASISPPPSPLAAISATKKRFALPIRPYRRPTSPIRKAQPMNTPSPPKMLSPRLHRTSYQGAWAKKIEAAADRLNLQLALIDGPPSPPPTTSLPQIPKQNGFHSLPNAQGFDSAPLTSPFEEPLSPIRTFNPQSHAQITPLSSPTFNSPGAIHSSFPQTHISSLAPSALNQAGIGPLTPPPSQKLPMTAWNPEPQDFLDYSYSASPSFPSSKAEAWWSPVSPMQPCAPTYQNSAQNANDALIGLGLQGVNAGNLSPENAMNQYELNTVSLDSLLQSPTANVHSTPYTSPQLISPPTFLASTPITPSTQQTPMKKTRTSSASPSPATRQTRTASRVRQAHRRAQSQHHRRKSGSKEAGGQRPVSVGFVNFTPDDSRKILTGVAPSGSSKTKARREKEAAEKRRKLSEAAKRAIMEAGGDVAALEREGLLCLMSAEI